MKMRSVQFSHRDLVIEILVIEILVIEILKKWLLSLEKFRVVTQIFLKIQKIVMIL